MMPRLTLTFDNGPWPGVTESVLDVLAERDVLATFFVVGEQLAKPGGRALAERARAGGHWIGNHTMTHSVPFGDQPEQAYLEEEITGTQKLLGGLAHPDRLFRPFGRGGVLDERLLSQPAVDLLTDGDYTMVLWNCVPRDWEDPKGWPDRVIEELDHTEHVVAVLHDLPTGAMEQLGTFIDRVLLDRVEITQELPDSCVPMRRGELVGSLDGLVRVS
ncbi:MAG: peptidoglycan-N-acetylglucosamine deacetylase [Acidimicrobiaceae bacterium]